VSETNNQRLLALLTSHWISMLGVALVTLAGCAWLFALPAHMHGRADNPYIGLLVFIAIPIVFFLGLALIPIGIWIGKRRIAAGLAQLPDRPAALRRVTIFFGVMTVANILIGSQVSYRAVDHMETVQFCGQTCHVMRPEFAAHQLPPHRSVACVECHVTPGASGWARSKMAGTRQLLAVTFNNYPRPIESAMESNRLVSSAETCEQCHSRDKAAGPRLRVISHFKDDEANSRTETVLLMQVGGGAYGGIHGAHLGPGIRIRYAAADKKRQEIPWVEYRSATGTRTYVASGAKPESIGAMPVFEMQCVDCHNRAAHSFETPERAIDDAMAHGEIATGLPHVKKAGLELLKGSYSSGDEAAQKIPAALASFYQRQLPEAAAKRSEEIRFTGQSVAAIYRRNVFPDLKVTWGTYPNNMGHTDYPGCFRCHDDSHSTSDKKTITQDCGSCHQSLAVEEASPEILKTLGLDEKLLTLNTNR
jgi:formate-dependent nitrite reductase cytochrome c552 subunit